MAGSRRATSANSSPGSGGHCGGRALVREGRWWQLSLNAPLTDTSTLFLSLSDLMHSCTQPSKHTGTHLFIHFSFACSYVLESLNYSCSLSQLCHPCCSGNPTPYSVSMRLSRTRTQPNSCLGFKNVEWGLVHRALRTQ